MKMKKFIAFGLGGKPLNSKISYEVFENTETYFIESRGGKRGHVTARNPDYNEALEELLRTHQSKKSLIEDILVDSEKIKVLPPKDRRVDGPDHPLPIDLSSLQDQDIVELRRYIGRTIKYIGQVPGAKGGNNQKKLLIRFRLDKQKINNEYGAEDLFRFRKRDFKNSGPPPSMHRKATNKFSSDLGFVYAFWLKGLSNKKQNALKVGYTEDLVARYNQLNKELRTSVTDLQWVEHAFFQFTNTTDAYQFEQELHFQLREYLYTGEREIFNLSTKQFDDILNSSEHLESSSLIV